MEGQGNTMETKTEIATIVGYNQDNENFGDYVREIYKHMTADDVRDAIKRANLYSPEASDKLFAAHKACDEVAELKELSHGNIAHWAALGAESMSGSRISVTDFKPPKYLGPPTSPYETLDELRIIVEDAIRESDEDGSPWSDEDKAKVRTWLSQTPYQIWLLVNELEEWGQDALRESMFDMTRAQDDGKDLARNIRQHWELALMDNWARNWKSRWDGSVPAPFA